MKKYEILLNENEVILLQGMINHCMQKKMYFINNKHTFDALATLDDINCKLYNGIEVDK
jgi:hypothetical protein